MVFSLLDFWHLVKARHWVYSAMEWTVGSQYGGKDREHDELQMLRFLVRHIVKVRPSRLTIVAPITHNLRRRDQGERLLLAMNERAAKACIGRLKFCSDRLHLALGRSDEYAVLSERGRGSLHTGIRCPELQTKRRSPDERVQSLQSRQS